MADFCTNCAREMWDEDFAPDIDIQMIADSLVPGSYQPVLCEGCGLRAIGKTPNGMIRLAVPATDDDVQWISMDEWQKNYKFNQL